MRTGIIYRYLNLESGKIYVGQTVNPERRFKQHLQSSQRDWHVDYQKHPEKYEYIVVEDNIPEDKLDEREIYWIDFFDSYNNGYNLTEGGVGNRGYKHTEETKLYMSNLHSGEGNPMYGIHMCGENAPMFGKHLSDETKRKISEAESGEKHHNYGKHHSEETKKKISDAQKGHTPWNKGKTGLHWYNNGVKNRMCIECPEGYVPGKIQNKIEP